MADYIPTTTTNTWRSTVLVYVGPKGFSVYVIEAQLFLCLWHKFLFIFLFMAYEKSVYDI